MSQDAMFSQTGKTFLHTRAVGISKRCVHPVAPTASITLSKTSTYRSE